MSGRGHGKVILLGEHAVVYGEPALCGALGRGVIAYVTAVRDAGLRVEVHSWRLLGETGDGSFFGQALDALYTALGGPAAVGGASVVCEADLPSGAGLGGSSALSAAIARALLGPRATDALVERAAAAADEVFHGRPSGVDAALATLGGVGVFRKGEGFQPLATPALEMLVIPTGTSRVTREMVDRVAQLWYREPETARRLCASIGGLVKEAVDLLLRAPLDYPALGSLMDSNQAMLAALGVSTPELDEACFRARAAGALGAKLTGAGGGGCAIALSPPLRSTSLRAALLAQHPETFVVVVGGAHAAGARA